MKKLTPFLLVALLACHSLPLVAQQPLKMRDTSISGPQTFAIVLGVSKYKYIRPLRYAHRDAELFRDYLKSPGGGQLKEENIFCLLNEEAQNSTFWSKGFQWLKAKQLRKGDRLFIYLAGHGDAIDEDQFFFLTYDCNPAGDKNNYLAGGAIQLFNLKKKIAAETTKGVEVFFIMDACRSNELPGGVAGMNFLNTAVSEKKAGEVIMLATAAGEASLEDPSIGNGHGLFTYYLVDGLTGVADTRNGSDRKVTFREIQQYISDNVPSIALSRFNRKQDPYFCCNEYDDKVISTVDTAYLGNWLKQKRNANRGGGNSFSGEIISSYAYHAADTALLETYNRFYTAVKNKRITGNSSAEEYFRQLDKKFPGNPYTLDAKTTLAVEYINGAQERVTGYLGCSDDRSARYKQQNNELGINLEKAMAILRDDEPEFAQSLAGRMYFLKAGGDFENSPSAFTHAYNAMASEPNAAYIQHRLAALHLENKNNDSARYYAEKAAALAPNWPCAMTMLALAGQSVNEPSKPQPRKPKVPGSRKFSFGGVVAGGYSQPSVDAPAAGTSDTIRFAGVDGGMKFELGFSGFASLGGNIAIRPSVVLSVESNELTFLRRNQSGGFIEEKVEIKTTAIALPVPFVFRLSGKNFAPFIAAGPTFRVIMQKDDANKAKLAINSMDLLGDIGLGADIGLLKNRIIISPELRYSRGLTNGRENNGTGYSSAVSKYAQQYFTFSIFLRGR